MPDLDPLLWPRSIVLVGASPDPSIIRGRVLAAVRQYGFEGPIHPVSRSHAEIDGLTCYPSVADLPGPVDLAIITIPSEHVASALEACGEKGVRAAVIISSGFAEEADEEGRARQRAIGTIAAKYGMAVCGPNAEGFLNALMPLSATFSPAVTHPDRALLPDHTRGGGIGVVSQSGGVGFAFFDRGRPKELRFTYVVSMGNEAGLDSLDVVEYLVADEATQVVLMFLEGFRAPRRFPAVANAAARAKKPLVVAKMGRSEAAARAAASHTASLAGSFRSYEAMFRHHGVLLADEIDQMVDIAAGFAYFGDRLPRGTRVGVLAASGGAAVWLSEACAKEGLEVPELDAETRAKIDAMIPAYGTSRNPVDITAQGVFNLGYAGALALIAASPVVDAIVVSCSLVHAEIIEAEAESLRQLGQSIDKPVVFSAYTRANPHAVAILAEAGFPCTTSMPNGARTIAAMAEYGAFLERFAAEEEEGAAARPMETAAGDARLDATGPVLPEYEAISLLAACGVPVSTGALTHDAAEAVTAAERYGGPVALKVQSPGIPHKTEAGALVLGLASAAAVEDAFGTIVANARAFDSQADIHGVLVQPMAAPGVEMIVGIHHDDDFGPMLMIGLGGILVEVLDDVAFAPVPVSRFQAEALLGRLRGAKLLNGVRGGPPSDTDALLDLLVALSRFAAAHGERLAEVDLNPVIVHPRGKGLTVVDALIVKREADAGREHGGELEP